MEAAAIGDKAIALSEKSPKLGGQLRKQRLVGDW